ncbi:M24 family metallopeptidase [Haloarcula sp. GH36]|uniref:M24 family metallopeptidase n=1 Tax=Haloarcula montana TaxID=3111776 RepID=UPI002D77797E|nr:Xaa-Pro peptidase family protein [Haloarcula sp. GH36]
MVDNDRTSQYPRFSVSEYERRYEAVREMLDEAGIDALVIYGNSKSGCSNINYLANYLGQFHNYLVVFADPTEDSTLFVGLTNHVQYADEVSIVDDVRWGEFPAMETIVDRVGGTAAAEGTIGIVGISPRFGVTIPHAHYETLDRELDAELVDATGVYGEIQLTKSEEELERLCRAAKHTDDAMRALAEGVEPGMHEYELRHVAQSGYLPEGGSPGISFVSTASMHDPGPGECYPWKDEPAERRIEAGDVITSEISASYWGYEGQLHRPIAVEEPPTDQYWEVFDIVSETHDRLLDALEPGATARDIVDATAPITEAGYTAPDAILHGYGTSLHPPWIGTVDSNYWPNREDPHLVPDGEFTFEEEMVVVIQPNAVTPDDRYGLQFGSTVHITDSGAELLTEYPLEFVQA